MPKKPKRFPRLNPLRKTGFSLVEILTTLVIISVLAGIGAVSYQKSVHHSQDLEALSAMQAIRSAEKRYQDVNGGFVKADSTQAINDLLGLDLPESLFTYKIVDASDSDYVVIAKRIGGDFSDIFGESVITMSSTGAVSYVEPTVVTETTTTTTSVSGGGGSSSGGSSSGGGTSSVTTTGGGGGTTVTTTTYTIIYGTSTPVLSLPFIPRGADLYTNWPAVAPDTGFSFLTGTGSDLLFDAMNLLVGNDPYNTIFDDIYRRKISIKFGDTTDFEGVNANKIAYMTRPVLLDSIPPDPPLFDPYILINPLYLSDTKETLAAVIVHEGTHFQEFLDGMFFDGVSTTLDWEYRAFVNQANFWDDIRDSQKPFTTPLEVQMEAIYSNAVAGEAQLKTAIKQAYNL